MPSVIRVIFAVSPRPSTMNRIGRTARHGTIETTATNGVSATPT